MILVVVLTRLLGVRNYGIWIQAGTAISFALELLCLNLGHALLRFSATKSFEERTNLFWTAAFAQWGAHFLAILLISPFARQIGNLLFSKDTGLTIIIVILISGLLAFQGLMRNFLISYGRSILVGQFSSLSAILTTLSTILGGFLFKNIDGALYGLFFGRIFENLLLFVIIRKDLHFTYFNFSLFTVLIKFSLPLLPVGVAFWVCQLSDRFFIKYYLGLEAVAKYGVSYSLPSMVSLIYLSLANIFFSSLVKLYELREYQQVGWWISSMIRIYIVIGTAIIFSFFAALHRI